MINDIKSNIDNRKMEREAYNMFDIDLSFNLGTEYKIANAHYVGLRLGYDMNLLGTSKKTEYDVVARKFKYNGRSKVYIDYLSPLLTGTSLVSSVFIVSNCFVKRGW